MRARAARPLTGRGVLVIMVAAFGVVIGANLAMAWFATGSFPGLVVENSYVASQAFDARRAALAAKGWRTRAAWRDGAVALDVTDGEGVPVRGLEVTARLGRPASALTDREVVLAPRGGGYRGEIALDPGRWAAVFRLDDGSGTPVELQSIIRVRGGG